eukprot:m.98487 g.98487  ORF g.98487 m.98487 type:complete len:236 (-) comp22105_c4_seq2:886-1593(-)
MTQLSLPNIDQLCQDADLTSFALAPNDDLFASFASPLDINNSFPELPLSASSPSSSSQSSDTSPLIALPSSTDWRQRAFFEPSMLNMDELKTELRLRNCVISGNKATLVARLQDAIANGNQPYRLTTRKRKRLNKKEPQPEDFATAAEYKDAWTRWRDARNNNNQSVKKSRDASRRRRLENELLCEEQERQNEELEQRVDELRDEMSFLLKALRTPDALTAEERSRMRSLLCAIA